MGPFYRISNFSKLFQIFHFPFFFSKMCRIIASNDRSKYISWNICQMNSIQFRQKSSEIVRKWSACVFVSRRVARRKLQQRGRKWNAVKNVNRSISIFIHNVYRGRISKRNVFGSLEMFKFASRGTFFNNGRSTDFIGFKNIPAARSSTFFFYNLQRNHRESVRLRPSRGETLQTRFLKRVSLLLLACQPLATSDLIQNTFRSILCQIFRQWRCAFSFSGTRFLGHGDVFLIIWKVYILRYFLLSTIFLLRLINV